jgi:GNAT superfamily N-acetyltransferase
MSRPGHPVEIDRGYRAGMIGQIVNMHMRYYEREYRFGSKFEAIVARGLADFVERLDRPDNAIWIAHSNGAIVGSVAIDGEGLGGNSAHLRWFIVDDAARGSGAGRQLLQAALAFVDASRFVETHLWTFAGLGAARHLYESVGFRCVEQTPGTQWGPEVLEQRFVRLKPSQAT